MISLVQSVAMDPNNMLMELLIKIDAAGELAQRLQLYYLIMDMHVRMKASAAGTDYGKLVANPFVAAGANRVI